MIVDSCHPDGITHNSKTPPCVILSEAKDLFASTNKGCAVFTDSSSLYSSEWHESMDNYQLSTIKTMTKDTWSKILNIVITVLTAIATTFGVTSCMGV